METISIWPIIISAILAMVVGAIWFGPLFGKTWMQIIGADKDDEKKRKEMQKKAAPLYFINFILVLFQVWVLSLYIHGAIDEMSAMSNAVWIWAAFVMPTIAGSAMWNNNPTKVKWAQFLIQSGYQLLMFIIFAMVITKWM